MAAARPKLGGVLETALYVDDLKRSVEFYQRIFGFEPIEKDERLWALSVEGRHVLLVCQRGASANLPHTAHDATGQQHLCFAVDAAELDAWEKWLTENGVEIVERRTWPRAGCSLYFRDPDGHVLELATPGTWTIY
ncbi:MAG: VOC family protein [Acidobacteria bacterium]|nr:VOC family protein [Acidobacteriota bacterium]